MRVISILTMTAMLFTLSMAPVSANSNTGQGNTTVSISGSFNDLFKNLENDFKKLGDDVSVELKKSTDQFNNDIKKSGKELEDAFKGFGDQLSSEIKTAGDKITSDLNKTADQLKTAGENAADKANQQYNNALGGLDQTVDTVVTRAEDVVSDTTGKAQTAADQGKASLQDLIAKLKTSLAKLEDQVKDGKVTAKEQQTKLENELKGIADSIKITFENSASNFKTLTSNGANTVTTTANNAVTTATSNANNAVNSARNTVTNTASQVTQTSNSLKDQLKQLGNQLRSDLKKAGNDLSSEFKKAGDQIGNSLKDAVDDLNVNLSSALTGQTVYGTDKSIQVTVGSSGAVSSTSTTTASTKASDFTMVENAEPPFTFSTSPYPGKDKDNYCGQYAMTTVFKSLGIDKSFDQVYQDTNPAGIFTAPQNITEYLSENGVENSMKQNASVADLKTQLDTGNPAMILVDAGSAPHWVAVVGYRTTEDGKTEFRVCDSYWGVSKGYATIGEDELNSIWNKPLGGGALGMATNYSNLMISIKGKVTPPAKQSILVTPNSTNVEDALGSGICEVVAGWKNKNVGKVAEGIGDTVAGVLGAIPNLAGKAMASGSTSLQNWGKNQSEKGGFFNKLIGGLANGVGKVGEVGGSILETTGNVITSAAQTAVNGVGKVVSGIGNFFSGLFK